MFIESLSYDIAINSEKIEFLEINKNPEYWGNESSEYEYCLFAYTTKSRKIKDAFCLAESDNMEELCEMMKKLVSDINANRKS